MKTIKESILSSTSTGKYVIVKEEIENWIVEQRKLGKLSSGPFTVNPDLSVSFQDFLELNDIEFPYKIKEIFKKHIAYTRIRLNKCTSLDNLPESIDALLIDNCPIKDISSCPEIKRFLNIIHHPYGSVPKLPKYIPHVIIEECVFKDLAGICSSPFIELNRMDYLRSLKGIISDKYTRVDINDCNMLEWIDSFSIKGTEMGSLNISRCSIFRGFKMKNFYIKALEISGLNLIRSFEDWPKTGALSVSSIGELDNYTEFPESENIFLAFKAYGRSKIPWNIEDYTEMIKKKTGAKRVIIN